MFVGNGQQEVAGELNDSLERNNSTAPISIKMLR
jgi:hypothetical protein